MALRPPPDWVRLPIKPQHRDEIEARALQWGWCVHRTIDGVSVRTDESLTSKPPSLLVPQRIADARDAALPATWECVREWPRQSDDLGMSRERIAAEIERHKTSGTITGWWHAIELRVFMTPQEQLARVLQMVMVEDIIPKYPYASLWRVAVSELFDRRMAALRALLTMQEAPEVINRVPFKGFPVAKGLMNGTSLGFEAYLEPALMALAPHLVGIEAPRMNGPLMFLFGTPQRGRDIRTSHDLLDLYRPDAMAVDEPLPDRVTQIGTWDIEAFFRWWVERLNLLFGQLLDPTMFTDEHETYDVARHAAAILSVERLFTCLHYALSTSGGRDEFLRQFLLFHVMDMLQGLRRGDFDDLVNASNVERTLERLKAELPPKVAVIALWKCERALQALKAVARQFYLHERIRDGKLQVGGDDGQPQWLAIEKAVAQYLQLIRNATHTFMKGMQKPRQRSIFVAHTALLDDALPDLAFLHVVNLLHEAGTLRF